MNDSGATVQSNRLGALAPRLFLLGGGEYFGITIQDVSGSWREFRAALEYYPVPYLGVGAAYRYGRNSSESCLVSGGW